MMKSRWMARTASAALVVAMSLGASGCKKAPGGQVAAVVNDEEITQREVRAEMTPQDQQANQDPVASTRAVLDRVIDRNLLAQYAREQGLDRDPEYVTRRRQLEQALLATMAMRKIAGPDASPGPQAAQAFINANPYMFGQRQIVALDQIRMASPNPVSKIEVYSRMGSIDAIAAALRAEHIPFTRSRQEMDTGSAANDFARQMLALKNGEPFALSTNGTSYLSAIVGRTPAVTPREGWLPAATDAVRQQKGSERVNAEIARLRKAAEITYDPAFKMAAPAKDRNAAAVAGNRDTAQ